MKIQRLSQCVFTLLLALFLGGCVVLEEPLPAAQVMLPNVHCIYDADCTVTIEDHTAEFPIPQSKVKGIVQSRLLPVGEAGTVGAGLYGYEYRVSLSQVLVSAANPTCIHTLALDFGPIMPMDYDGDGNVEDAFVITSGGLGTIKPTAIDQMDQQLYLTFDPAVCTGTAKLEGASSVFIGLTSIFPPKETTGQIAGNQRLLEAVTLLAPDYSNPAAPIVFGTPSAGMPTATIRITGGGYRPGGYIGTILWDGANIKTFDIPPGGSFAQEFTIPADAAPGTHTIAVCSLNPCATADFEQKAETIFTVQPKLDYQIFLPIVTTTVTAAE